jgi:hypothetical protein
MRLLVIKGNSGMFIALAMGSCPCGRAALALACPARRKPVAALGRVAARGAQITAFTDFRAIFKAMTSRDVTAARLSPHTLAYSLPHLKFPKKSSPASSMAFV